MTHILVSNRPRSEEDDIFPLPTLYAWARSHVYLSSVREAQDTARPNVEAKKEESSFA